MYLVMLVRDGLCYIKISCLLTDLFMVKSLLSSFKSIVNFTLQCIKAINYKFVTIFLKRIFMNYYFTHKYLIGDLIGSHYTIPISYIVKLKVILF